MIKVRLIMLLEAKGKTTDDLVEDLEMSAGIVRKLADMSANEIHFDVLEGLCTYLDCSVGELLVHED